MLLPQVFDKNEWFIIISLVLSFAIVLYLPKRFPLSITILIMLFSATVARICDHLLASPSLDLYDITDTGKYDLFDLFTYTMYGPFAYLFIYIFIALNLKGIGIVLYILICSLGGTLFEGISAAFNVFTYKWWELSYSFSVYLVTQPLTLLFYFYIKKQYDSLQIMKTDS